MSKWKKQLKAKDPPSYPVLRVSPATPFDGRSCNFCVEPHDEVFRISSQQTSLMVRICRRCIEEFKAQVK